MVSAQQLPLLVFLGPPAAGKTLARITLESHDYPPELLREGRTRFSKELPGISVHINTLADAAALRVAVPNAVLVWVDASTTDRWHRLVRDSSKMTFPSQQDFALSDRAMALPNGIPQDRWVNPKLVRGACDLVIFNTGKRFEFGEHLKVLYERCMTGYYHTHRASRSQTVLGRDPSMVTVQKRFL